MKTQLTSSQEELVALAKKKLRQRRIVFFQGEANGKTTMMQRLAHEIEKEQNFLARHEENWKLEAMPDLCRLPRFTTTTAVMRLILDAYGKLSWYGNLRKTEKDYKTLMLSLRDQKTIPVLPIDNVEALGRKAFITLKELNEYRVNDLPAGIGIAIAGDVLRSKMPPVFYEKCAEITVERLDKDREIRDILAIKFPTHAHLFGKPALEALKSCRSVQQMVKAADLMVDEWDEKSTSRRGEMPEDLALKMASRAKRLVRLAA